MAINKVEKDNITYQINDARIDYNALTEGTVDKAVGFDASGNLIKGTVSGGGSDTHLYRHLVRFEAKIDENEHCGVIIYIVNATNTSIVSWDLLSQNINGALFGMVVFGSGYKDNTPIMLMASIDGQTVIVLSNGSSISADNIQSEIQDMLVSQII